MRELGPDIEFAVRIRAIDDVVLFRVKTGRWRGAVLADEPNSEVRDWLVAAGIREDGSNDDFYTSLHRDARTARQRYNAEHDKPLTTDTYVGHLLPNQDDHDRYLLEAGTRLALRLNTELRALIRGSLHDGHEHAADFPTFRLGVVVRADDGHETYVAIRITGSVPTNLTVMILSRAPAARLMLGFPNTLCPNVTCYPPNKSGQI
ncbi:hypothetical protein [Nonomuraea sp. NPDC050786]|uniref:hypothetical protein n=1 Tax=Nonomuraea sp. NPDC050786 TaxID=3154840 RepID=UPI0033CA33C7